MIYDTWGALTGGAQTPQTAVLRVDSSSAGAGSCTPPNAGKSCEGFPPGGVPWCFFIVWKRKHLGLILPAPAAFPAPGRMLRGSGASAAWSGVERGCAAASAPGPAGSASLGRCPRQGLASCRSPRPFQMGLLSLSSAGLERVFLPGREDLEPRAAYSPAPCSPPQQALTPSALAPALRAFSCIKA